MRVLVCGGRDFTDLKTASNVLDIYHRDCHFTDLICGMARGADMLGHYWARHTLTHDGRLIRIWQYPADWKTNGKAAGPIRNKQMLDEGKPDLVIAFWDGLSRGTDNMIQQAKNAGVPVKIITIVYD